MNPTLLSTRLGALLLSATLAIGLQPKAVLAADTHRRPVPPVAAACDVTDWTLAQHGRDRLPAPAAGAETLLLLSGGFQAVASEAIPALLDAAGFDVVNLAHRDVRRNAAGIAGTRAQIVSASFARDDGSTPWKSHAIVDRGGKRTAVIGIASRSDFEPMEGLRYIEAGVALPKAIAEAGAVDAVVVLADMPLADAAAIMRQVAAVDLMLVSGRGGGSTTIEGLPNILRVPPGGHAVAVRPADPAKPAHVLRLPAPSEVSPGYAAAVKQFNLQPKLPVLGKDAPAVAALSAPTSLEDNILAPHGVRAANRAAAATVRAAGYFTSFAGKTAPEGRKFLVVDLEFRNTLTPQIVRDRLVPVQYLVPNLSDHLYLVADERQVLPPLADLDVAGQFKVDGELSLPRAGAVETGKLIYEVDAAAPPRQLTLRMYDYAHGHFTLPVLAPGEPIKAEEPTIKPQRNEVLELTVFDLQKQDQLGDEKAPEGMVFLTFDLRALSQFKYPADATGFDPNARPGQKISVGTVADWTDAYKYCQLVVNGAYAYTPIEPHSRLQASPRFLPDVMTGGRLVFVAPRDAVSLELQCDFPNARLPDGKVIHPRPIKLALEGREPLRPNQRPIAKIEDDVYLVEVLNQASPAAFAGSVPEEGHRFVVLDIAVQNRNRETGEFFQVVEQLKIAGGDGNPLAVDENATFAGVYRPSRHVWIPTADRRTFQVVYQLPTTETAPRLLYSGVSKSETIELARLAPAAAPGKSGVANDPEPAPAPPDNLDQPAAPSARPMATMIEVDGKRFPARVPVKPDIKPKGLAGVGLKPEEVNAAIDRGSAFLWNYIKTKDLTSPREKLGDDREHVLAALALVHAGAHRKVPEFDQHLRKLLAGFEVNYHHDTYQIGLYCMLIQAYGDPTYLPQLRLAARWLIDNQGAKGSWGYGRALDEKLFATDRLDTKVLQVSGGHPPAEHGAAEPIARVTELNPQMDGDNSVTQYALLGLHAASRARVKSSPDLWQRALAVHQERQTDDGGWAYTTGSSGYGSMTAAGICALAIARHELGATADTQDLTQRIERGLAWLNAHFTVLDHPQSEGKWVYYYLYALERVGRILDTEFIGEHEWYPLGASRLVTMQNDDGSWMGPGEEADPRVATSFALLFLTRATETLDEAPRSGPGTLLTAVSLPPGRKLYIILDASGSMLEEMGGRPKIDIAREALSALVKELPPNTQVALRAYGYRKRAIEQGANEDTKLLVPMAPLQKDKLLELLSGIRARGKTPLALSLEQAATELPSASADDPLTVLLLTDGGEDTQPRRDPVAAAAAFGKLANVRLRIIGFDINRQDWQQQLQEMARAAGGQYLGAASTDTLLRELRTAVFETPEDYVVIDDATDKQVATGKFGTQAELPAGKYRIRSSYAGQTFEEQLWINPGATTAVTFNAVAVPIGSAAGVPAPPPARPEASPQPARSKFCTSCGAALGDAGKFCTSCGAAAPK